MSASPQGKRSAGTRERVLEAACKAFADKGYRDTTVAEICRRAGANIAAVNYHFGSKEALYRQAWQWAHRAMLDAFPADGGVDPRAAAEQRLRGRIRSTLQRALSEDGLEYRIMSHEMANPMGLLEQVIQDTIRPLAEATEGILRELLGPAADRQVVRLCAASVIGPCLHVMRRQRMQRRLGRRPWFARGTLEALVEHFTTFSLAGVREVGRRIAAQADPAESSAEGG